MNLSDAVRGCSGRFELRVYRCGLLVDEVDEQNMVVAGSALVLASLLAGGVQPLVRFGVGTNSSTPALGNASLAGYQHLPLGVADFPSPGAVRFQFSVGPGDFNGAAISEFGLLTSADVLFARKSRPAPILKTSDVSFSGSWTISFKA